MAVGVEERLSWKAWEGAGDQTWGPCGQKADGVRKDSVAGPRRRLAREDEVRGRTGCLGWGSADIRAPGPEELRLVPAGNTRGPIVPRAWLPTGTQQAGGTRDCRADGWIFIFVISFQPRDTGTAREGSAACRDSTSRSCGLSSGACGPHDSQGPPGCPQVFRGPWGMVSMKPRAAEPHGVRAVSPTPTFPGPCSEGSSWRGGGARTRESNAPAVATPPRSNCFLRSLSSPTSQRGGGR